MNSPINIFWFRRDLRLDDNHGLFKACEEGQTLPIFIFDKAILDQLYSDDKRVQFIFKTLESLNLILKSKGKSIQVYYGDVLDIWKELINTYSIKSVYTNSDYEPYALKRDQQVKALLTQYDIEFFSFKDQVIFEKSEVVKDDGKPYTVYTPYKNKWLKTFTKDHLKPFSSDTCLDQLVDCEPRAISLEDLGFQSTNLEIREPQLDHLNMYDETRDFPDLDQTSYLSVYLRFGLWSIRRAVKLALETNETWLSELIWRSFFMQILYHYPESVHQPFKKQYAQLKWRNNQEEFERWCKGETGYPLVDAGMRQLNETGYMHNRVRMVCASFLCKHLLIDWRWGETYFAQKLLDFDLSANVGNWQWAASTGCDAVPYFRIFNPETQLKKFDKDLKYVRTWVTDFDEFTYPQPMVDHKMARERCLEAFKAYR